MRKLSVRWLCGLVLALSACGSTGDTGSGDSGAVADPRCASIMAGDNCGACTINTCCTQALACQADTNCAACATGQASCDFSTITSNAAWQGIIACQTGPCSGACQLSQPCPSIVCAASGAGCPSRCQSSSCAATGHCS